MVAVVAAVGLVGPFGAAASAHADIQTDDASMVRRTLSIYSIEADPTMVTTKGHDGWGIRLNASDRGTTTPHPTGYRGWLTLTGGSVVVAEKVSSDSTGAVTPQVDSALFPNGPIALHIELTTTGTTDTAIYDNPYFVEARRDTTKAAIVDNGGCVVSGTRRVLWGDFSVTGWGSRAADVKVVQRLSRAGKVVLTRDLDVRTLPRHFESSFDKPWPTYIERVNWAWNGRIQGKVHPGVYRSQITVTDRSTGAVYRLPTSPGLKVLPASAKTCVNVWYH